MVGAWILVAGGFIPNRPIWTLATALAAATMWPLACAINAARFDFALSPWPQLAVWPGLNYLLATLTYPIAHRLYGTAIEAERAEDLGSYRLAAPIGYGGMGEVWTATHRMLARRAAIKLVKPDGLSARQAELVAKRFRREANAIAALQSPHTIYLYDFGTSDDGRFYYVMELLDGISLEALVRTFGPQPASRVVAILTQICDSLEEAHHQHLVHRDLKPSNVMICKVALRHDVVKVLDFGLAKSLSGADGATQLTMEGMASGTPGYIAPEISTGDGAVDHRADIYALGCVAYYLLTGTMVFDEASPVAMALKHVQATPDPPSLRTELPIPPSLERVVLDCLAKRPEDRPAGARQVAMRLAACGVPPWTPADADTWWERHLPPTSSLRAHSDAAARTPAVVRKR
jgi:eukaryotic-like serine/threonine-protein kinase